MSLAQPPPHELRFWRLVKKKKIIHLLFFLDSRLVCLTTPLPPPTFKNDLPGPSSYIQSINEYPPPPKKKETCRCYHNNVIYIQFLYIIFPSLSKILFTSRSKFYITNAVKYKYPQHVPRRTTHSCYTVYDDFKLYWKDNGPFFHKVCFFKKWDKSYRMELCNYSEDAIARLPSKKPFSASFYQSGFL